MFEQDENLLHKYEKYKININDLEVFSTTIDWSKKPCFKLFLVAEDVEYKIYDIKNACELNEKIEEYKLNEDYSLYIIPTDKYITIYSLKTYLKKRYEVFYDDLHEYPILKYFSTIKIISILAFLGVLMVVALKVQWIKLGLPLESLPKDGVFEDYLSVLAFIIMEYFFKAIWLPIIILFFISIILIVVDKKVSYFEFPNFRKYISFYAKRVLFLFLSFTFSLVVVLNIIFIYQQFSSKESNAIIETILDVTLYPKIVEYDNKLNLISHVDGKNAYIQNINIEKFNREDCKKQQLIIRDLNLSINGYVAVKYDDFNISKISTLEEFCDSLNEDGK